MNPVLVVKILCGKMIPFGVILSLRMNHHVAKIPSVKKDLVAKIPFGMMVEEATLLDARIPILTWVEMNAPA